MTEISILLTKPGFGWVTSPGRHTTECGSSRSQLLFVLSDMMSWPTQNSLLGPKNKTHLCSRFLPSRSLMHWCSVFQLDWWVRRAKRYGRKDGTWDPAWKDQARKRCNTQVLAVRWIQKILCMVEKGDSPGRQTAEKTTCGFRMWTAVLSNRTWHQPWNPVFVLALTQYFWAIYLSVCKNTKENTAGWAVMGLCCACNALWSPEKNRAEEIEIWDET